MKKPETLVCDAPGFRLDRFLALRRPELSRGHWRQLIDNGAVTVDGTPRPADYELKDGQRVAVVHPETGWSQQQDFDSWLIHEDKDLLVLDKPAGLLMHPLGDSWLRRPEAALAEREPNLAGILQKARPALGKVYRCGIVHRLDRQTSGVLLVAKNERAQEELLSAFKERRVKKVYRALVRGVPAQKATRVQAPIGRKPGHRKVVVTPFGKSAETDFSVVETGGAAAIIEARPLTGRTHQIRAHLSLIGHPVAGDVEFDAVSPKPARMLLHAFKIDFTHPGTGKPVSYTARLPKDFTEFWKKVKR